MAERMPLVDLPDGSTFQFTARKVGVVDGAIETEFLREDGSSGGTLRLTGFGELEGTWDMTAGPPMVVPLAIAMAAGDVMRNEQTGERVVVMATGFGPDERLWSPSPNRQPAYAPEGWVKVGHVDPQDL